LLQRSGTLAPATLGMGTSCVRAVEPGFDATPTRLLIKDAPVKLHEKQGVLPDFDIMIRDGHEQSPFEATLEALGQALVHGVEQQPHCGGEELASPRSRSRGRAESGTAFVTPVRADSPLPPHLRTPQTRMPLTPRRNQDCQSSPRSSPRDLGLGPRRCSSLSSGQEDTTVPCVASLANRSHSQLTACSSTFWDVEGLNQGWTPRTAKEAEAASPSRASRGSIHSRPIPDEFAATGQNVTSAWCRGVCCGCVAMYPSPTQTILTEGYSPKQEYLKQGPVLPPVLGLHNCCRDAPDDGVVYVVAKQPADFCALDDTSEAGSLGGPRTVRVHHHGAQGGA